ncbi:hypothetical protein DN062_08420 [Nitrincola tibetensis]|uniref:Glycosyltransferase 2-like domain-containing protein n=1 Tax=Nitrincola tibetensis TaxID=2219697 RepID=A0A364NMA8_9GAMM|nr:glycosyltransferase [Nitrincola tibetensis]RAU18249.1 hypothetical protein DN062_08420 [Nitrincola tibetensis]
MALSIIIPVGYDPNGLKITLSSLFNQNKNEIPFEIIVINDGYDLIVESVCFDFNVIHFPIYNNVGPAEGRNIGIRLAKYNLILFIDADVRVSKNWIELMYNSLNNYDYVGGKIEIDKKLITNFFEEYDAISAFDVINYMKRGHAPTANLGVRREVFEQVGYFMSNLRSGEDTEFGDRVYSKNKFLFYYDNDAVVYHPPRSIKAQLLKKSRVIKGHLNLANKFPDRYITYKETYLNPFIMLRPPIAQFRKIFKINNLSSMKKISFCSYAYFLKVYSFFCAIKFIITPTAVKLETKRDLSQ